MTQKPKRRTRLSSSANIPANVSGQRSSRRWKMRLSLAGTVAATVGGSVWFNRARARRAEEETPPRGKFVEVDGVRLHYVDKGEGSPVVLLHGNGVSLQDYQVSGVFDLAAEHRRVIAFDRPGFGYSDRPRDVVWSPEGQAQVIAKALQKMGVKQAVMVGHSWGTLLALAMALNHPEEVAGLVLLSGYYYGTARPDVIAPSLMALPIIGDVLANTIAPIVGLASGPVAVKASFAPAKVPDKFSAFPIALGLRPSQMRATAADTALMIPAAVALSSRYAEINLPAIIMAGAGDLIVHVKNHSERLVEDLQQAELRIVPGQGHMFHYAVPEQVVAAIDCVGSVALSQRLYPSA